MTRRIAHAIGDPHAPCALIVALTMPSSFPAADRAAQTGFETIRIRGQITIEGGGPLSDARIKTDAIRGATMSQFAAQRLFTTRTGRDGEWSILGITRGLWVLEITARDHLPHVLVVPIYLMLQPEPVPWDTSLSLQPVTAVASRAGRRRRTGPPAARRRRPGDVRQVAARQGVAAEARRVQHSTHARSAPPATSPSLIREPSLARRFFELAATADEQWYRPQLGIASAAMMAFDFDRAIKGYAAARSAASNKRLERMLSLAVKDIQQIRTIGR